nr:Chain B, MEMBRANE-ASSOCIATED GUANYLATE KINASE, WW AND PDZ DOMAIN-CONTAINING PROTEIN 1 [Homo sapiens]
RRRERSPTR